MEYSNKDIMREIMIVETMLRDVYDATVDEEERKKCPICNNTLRLYLPHGVKLRKNAKCPVCGSVVRQRTLWLYMQEHKDILGEGQDIKILHFAPERPVFNKISMIEGVDYYPVDINPEFYGIRDVVDITNIQYEDNFFDLIICYHVLEHIPDDIKAMSELFRVLKPSGKALINVPFDKAREVTLEDEKYNTPELREKYYEQFDHVRLYGKDYVKRLEKVGFHVDTVHPNVNRSAHELKIYGVGADETIDICKKQ